MKLLLDENLSKRLLPFLQHQYPNSSHVSFLGLSSSTDELIWNYARSHGYVIVTRDVDFQEMSVLKGQPPPVIWLRSQSPSRISTLKFLIDYRDRISGVLEQDGLALVEIAQ